MQRIMLSQSLLKMKALKQTGSKCADVIYSSLIFIDLVEVEF